MGGCHGTHMVLVIPSFLCRYRFFSMLDQNGMGSHSRNGIFQQKKKNGRQAWMDGCFYAKEGASSVAARRSAEVMLSYAEHTEADADA